MNIKNNNVILYLETIFNKKITQISEEDLKLVKALPIDVLNNQGNEEFFNYSLLKFFPNLEEISIYNTLIDEEIIMFIQENSNILRVNFNKCAFVNETVLKELSSKQSLSFVNCFIENYNFLNGLESLEELCIKNPYSEIDIDLSFLLQCDSLKKLILEGCSLININALSNLKKCEYLSLLWSDIKEEDIYILLDMPSLKEIVIDNKYKENESIIKLNNSVNVSYDLIKYGFDK